MILTIEEAALIGAFDHRTKERTVIGMKRFLPLCFDPELKDCMKRTITKLQRMTEEEFQTIDLMEEDDGEQNEEESGPDLFLR